MTNIASLKKLFDDDDLLTQAFTHKSWVNENKGKRESNERLEFLGDAVLEIVVSDALYKQFPEKEEGYLTALRANLVNTVNLAKLAKKLNIGKEIYLSKGEEDTKGRQNPSLLADTMEAIIGAIYLDQGMQKAAEFIKKNLLTEVPEKIKEPLKDAKSRLQERVQADGYPTPKYKVVKENGPDHNKTFVVEVSVNGDIKGRGKGRNKAEAAQNAAEKALLDL